MALASILQRHIREETPVVEHLPEYDPTRDIENIRQHPVRKAELAKAKIRRAKRAEALEQHVASERAKLVEDDESIRHLEREISSSEQSERRLLCESKPTAEEIDLTEKGKQLLRKVGELRSRYSLYAAKVKPPEETEPVIRLSELEKEIATTEKHVDKISRNPGHTPGTSGAEIRLRKLLIEHGSLQPQVEKAHLSWKRFQEVQAVKQQAEETLAKRNHLQEERQKAYLAELLK